MHAHTYYANNCICLYENTNDARKLKEKTNRKCY